MGGTAVRRMQMYSHTFGAANKSSGFSASFGCPPPPPSMAPPAPFGAPRPAFAASFAGGPPPPPPPGGAPAPPGCGAPPSFGLSGAPPPPGPPGGLMMVDSVTNAKSSFHSLQMMRAESAASSDSEMSAGNDLLDYDDSDEPQAENQIVEEICSEVVALTNHRQIINLQDPSGFWQGQVKFEAQTYSEEVRGNTAKYLTSGAGNLEKVKNTIYCLVLLICKFSDKVLEWKLAASKAVAWVRKNGVFSDGNAFDADFFVDKCLNSALGESVDYDVLDELF